MSVMSWLYNVFVTVGTSIASVFGITPSAYIPLTESSYNVFASTDSKLAWYADHSNKIDGSPQLVSTLQSVSFTTSYDVSSEEFLDHTHKVSMSEYNDTIAVTLPVPGIEFPDMQLPVSLPPPVDDTPSFRDQMAHTMALGVLDFNLELLEEGES